MPDYVLRLLAYYTKVERLLAEQKIELNIQSGVELSKEAGLYEEYEN